VVSNLNNPEDKKTLDPSLYLPYRITRPKYTESSILKESIPYCAIQGSQY